MVNIAEYLGEIKKNWKIIIMVVISFVLISGLYTTFFMKQEYEASVKVFIGKQQFQSTTENYNNEEISLYQITTYSEVIKSKKLINKSINDSNVNNLSNKDEKITYDSVISNFTVNPITNTQIIEVKYKSLNPQKSYDLLYSTTENLIAYSKELYPTVNIKVLEQVHVNHGNLLSKKLMIVGLALILGLMAGVGGVLGFMYLDNTFKSKKSIEEQMGIPVLGVIPNVEFQRKIKVQDLVF